MMCTYECNKRLKHIYHQLDDASWYMHQDIRAQILKSAKFQLFYIRRLQLRLKSVQNDFLMKMYKYQGQGSKWKTHVE